MKLVLSTDAAPDLTLAELEEVAERRGIAGIELVAGHAHGVSPQAVPALESKPTISAYRASSLSEACSQEAAELSARLGSPVVVPQESMDGTNTLSRAVSAAAAYAASGGSLLLSHGTDAPTAESLRRGLEEAPELPLGLAWEVDPERDDLSRAADVLAAAGPYLRLVRLHGGGPEAARQEGRGVGALMARLTLARYAGALVLTPSDPRFHYAWSAWLGRAGGWGCGSKSQDPSLVTLNL